MVKGDTGVNEFNFSYSLKGLGHNTAAQVTYRNMFFYMIPQSTFKDAFLGTLKAAKDLYGSCSDELNHTYQAWKAVNVDDPNVVTVDLSHGILAPTQVCNGAPATVNLGSIGDKSRKVNWLVNYKDSASSLSYQYTFNKTGFYSVRLTTQTCNKTFVDSMTIAINFRPEPTFKTPFDTSCMIRDTVRFVNTTVNKDVFPLYYEWYVQPTDELYSTKDLNILFKEKLGYTINLKAYYKGGCWNQTQSVIQFKDAVKPSFTVLRNSCQGRPVKLNNTTDTIVNKLKFKWTFPDKSVVEGYLPGDKGIPDYGYFPIILSAEDDQVGCVDTSMAWVEIYRNPEPDFTYDSLCTLADAQLYAGGKFYHTPDWKMWHLGYANPYNKDTIKLQVPDSLYCTVGLTISDKRGCNSSIYKQLPIHQLHSSLVTSPVCLGDSTVFKADIQTPMAYVAQWKAGDGFSASGIPSKYRYLNPGKYAVQLHIKATHCEAINEVTAEVKDKAFPQFTVQDVCFGDTSSFVNTTKYSDPVDFEWYLGDGSNSTDKSVRHRYPSSKTATYIVKLIAKNPDGCSDSISLPHTVNELPECGFTFMRNPEDGNNSFVFTPAAKGQKSYLWKFGDGQTDTRENPVHSYVGNGVYYAELRIENEAGCMCENTLAVNAMYVGTNDLHSPGVRIYPNPFSNQIRIEAENTEIEICSSDGKVLLKKSIHGTEAIDVSHFAPGTYYLRSSTPGGIRATKLLKLAD